jgi:hypothetical protein
LRERGSRSHYGLSNKDRQKRYRTTGAAATLVKVETLVPPEGRAEILNLAARLRKRARRSAAQDRQVDVPAVLHRIAELCATQPRQYAARPDVDQIVATSVNVPFPIRIDAQTLAGTLQSENIPAGYHAHIERFLGETPIRLLLRFCDRHDISANRLRHFISKYRTRLALHRPDLDEHLDALVSHT